MKFNLATGLVCLLATTEAVGASSWWSKAGEPAMFVFLFCDKLSD